MSKKLTITVSLALLLCMLFSSCNKRIIIVDKETDTTAEDTTVYGSYDTTAPVTEESTITEYIIDNTPTISDAEEYRQIDLDTDRVLALYRSATKDVKSVCPGFSRTESLVTDNVVAGNGGSSLANSILDLVASSVLQGVDNNSTKTVMNGDRTSVTQYFPLYGETEGCTLYDTSIINSAVCYGNDTEYKIVITLNDCLNPESGSDFTKIMKPVDVDTIKEGISKYLVVLDRSQYQFDMDYTGCEIVCVLDKQTSRMKSLSMKMVIDVSININISVGLWNSDVVKCTGTLTDHTDFTDFGW